MYLNGRLSKVSSMQEDVVARRQEGGLQLFKAAYKLKNHRLKLVELIGD